MPQVLETIGPRAGAAPLAYELVELGTVDLQSVFASFDGTAASGAWRPALTIRSQNGTILSRTFPDDELATGDAADVTYAPFLRRGGSGGGSVVLTGSDGIVVTVIPGGYNVAANILGSGWTAIVQKQTDEQVASSIVLQNDDELFFTAVSGAWYEFELIVIYSQAAFNAGTSIVMDLGEDASKRGTAMTLLWSTVSLLGAVNSTTTNQSSFASGFLASTTQAAFAKGVHLGGGGTFRLRWAQSQSNVSPLIVYAGSLLRYRRFLN